MDFSVAELLEDQVQPLKVGKVRFGAYPRRLLILAGKNSFPSVSLSAVPSMGCTTPRGSLESVCCSLPLCRVTLEGQATRFCAEIREKEKTLWDVYAILKASSLALSRLL